MKLKFSTIFFFSYSYDAETGEPSTGQKVDVDLQPGAQGAKAKPKKGLLKRDALERDKDHDGEEGYVEVDTGIEIGGKKVTKQVRISDGGGANKFQRKVKTSSCNIIFNASLFLIFSISDN